ncbi:FolC bifunctional protein [[Clostridium] ultunense Esp]|nr:FolC bifunctional protein [[Clostridium] ultunense Esp]
MKNRQEAVDWIKSLRPFGYKPGTDRMVRMLERLNHPERQLKFVHIAGTNGKGSNVAFLASIFRENGYDVGTYISPGNTTYLSRIAYNGEEIQEGALVEIATTLKELADELALTEEGAPTEFEILTMIAILYFARYTYPDLVIWETGLGGLHDSTNVVYPLISLITNVAFDHMHILGNTLGEIAFQKAGIIKPGVPVVTGVNGGEAGRVIEEQAKEKRASIYRLGEEFRILDPVMNHERQTFTFQSPFRELKGLDLGLKGEHQFANAATALMAAELLRTYFAFHLEEEGIRKGLAKAANPGRMEVVNRHPLILLDGAHNPHGMRAVAHSIPALYSYRKMILLLSIMQDKLADEMLQALIPLAHTVVVTRARNKRALDPEQLAEKIRNINPRMPIYIVEEPTEAVKSALHLTEKEDLLFITGSLYLLESIRDELEREIAMKVGDID